MLRATVVLVIMLYVAAFHARPLADGDDNGALALGDGNGPLGNGDGKGCLGLCIEAGIVASTTATSTTTTPVPTMNTGTRPLTDDEDNEPLHW